MNYRESVRDISIDTKTILQFINGKDISGTVIDFYGKYIFRISELTITDSEHSVELKYIDRDLMQDLYLSVLECLPNLRKNIISDNDFKNDIVDILCNIGCFVMQSNFLFMRNPVTNFMEQLMTESSCF